MMDKPANCTCEYPKTILRNGSGHRDNCEAHQEWLGKGRSRNSKDGQMPKIQVERRRLTLPAKSIELRADGGVKKLSGHAAVYYDSRDPSTQYELWEGCFERLQRGCFDSALKRPDDVRCLFNHDPNFPLGRNAAGTLRMKSDDRGLWFECDLPDTGPGRDVAASIDRGDVTGCSFSFNVLLCTWTEDSANDLYYRDIQDVSLYDVGPVTFPAYGATDVETNSAKRSLQQFLEDQRKSPRRDKALRRLRLLSAR